MNTKPVLLLIEPGNTVRRFIGKTQTHHVESDRPLTAPELEQFRVSPESMIQPEAA